MTKGLLGPWFAQPLPGAPASCHCGTVHLKSRQGFCAEVSHGCPGVQRPGGSRWEPMYSLGIPCQTESRLNREPHQVVVVRWPSPAQSLYHSVQESAVFLVVTGMHAVLKNRLTTMRFAVLFTEAGFLPTLAKTVLTGSAQHRVSKTKHGCRCHVEMGSGVEADGSTSHSECIQAGSEQRYSALKVDDISCLH